MLTVGTDRRLLPRGARRGRGVPAGVCGGRPPPQRDDGLRRRRPGGAARAGRARALPGDRRDGARLLPRRRAARATRSARSPRRSSSRARLGKPLVIHSRDAADETLAQLGARSAGRERGDALLLDARAAARSAWTAGMRSRSRATSPTKAPPTSPPPRAQVPDERLLVETDAPYLTPAGGAQAAQPAGVRRAHGRVPRRAAGRRACRSWTRSWSATRRACSAGA